MMNEEIRKMFVAQLHAAKADPHDARAEQNLGYAAGLAGYGLLRGDISHEKHALLLEQVQAAREFRKALT